MILLMKGISVRLSGNFKIMVLKGLKCIIYQAIAGTDLAKLY
jgi:hypothetical protein